MALESLGTGQPHQIDVRLQSGRSQLKVQYYSILPQIFLIYILFVKKSSIAKIIMIKNKTANLSIKPSRVTLEMVSSHSYVTRCFLHDVILSSQEYEQSSLNILNPCWPSCREEHETFSFKAASTKSWPDRIGSRAWSRTGSDYGPGHRSTRLIAIINFAPQVKIKSAWHNEAGSSSGACLWLCRADFILACHAQFLILFNMIRSMICDPIPSDPVRSRFSWCPLHRDN